MKTIEIFGIYEDLKDSEMQFKELLALSCGITCILLWKTLRVFVVLAIVS